MPNHPLDRREFLATGATFAVLGAVAATEGCTPQTHSNAPSLEQFLQLSALLTGFEVSDLDPRLAQVYLDTLNAPVASEHSLANLITKTGIGSSKPPQSYAELERNGVFADEASQQLAEEIMKCWYSGTVPALNDLHIRVVTYDAALAWKSIDWTTPNMTCRGATGFWAEPPATGKA